MSESNELLARLLATENITVIQDNVQTASFQLKSRVLTIPLWENMEDYTRDALTGHEVGHALFTPVEGWLEGIKDAAERLNTSRKRFQNYVNIVEDARIEKLIQRRYPGLRSSFIKSYIKLLSDGFFGADIATIKETYPFVDLVNVHFKCGFRAGIKFSKEQTPWIEEIEHCETWEQAIDIAERLFVFCREQAQKEAEENEEESEDTTGENVSEEAVSNEYEFSPEGEEDGDSEETSGEEEGEYDTEGDSEETSGEEGEEGEGVESDGTSGEEETEEDDSGEGDSSETEEDDSGEGDSSETEEGDSEEFADPESEEGGYGLSSEFDEEIESLTDDILEKSIVDEFCSGETRSVYNLNLRKTFPNILSWKEVLEKVNSDVVYGLSADRAKENRALINKIGEREWSDFLRINKKTINYLMKEFQMKKRAADYRRETVAKTGVLDTIKMNNYKFSDDVFRRISVVPEGKNHGIVLYLDWSGTMSSHLKSTIDQALMIVQFCRQVGIAYRVYAFSDINEFGTDRHAAKNKAGDIVYNEFWLMELFNNNMNSRQHKEMAVVMKAVSIYYDYSQKFSADRNRLVIPGFMRLSGTPLTECIMAAIPLYHKFQKESNVDIVNTFFLTDGMGHPVTFIHERLDGHLFPTTARFFDKDIVRIHDEVTKKSYRLGKWEKMQDAMLRIFRDATKSQAIGYFICKPTPYATRSALPKYNAKSKEQLSRLKREGFILVPGSGYDIFYLINSAKMEASEVEIEVEEGAKKGKIKSAFVKSQKGRLLNRKMLNSLIETVS